jgi:aspartate aminotransferase-like enzyme
MRALISLLPGPVEIADVVREAYCARPVSHRGSEFAQTFGEVRRTLGELAGGAEVALFNGGGTLANDAIASALAALKQPGRGLVLANGEFGGRLPEQLARYPLAFDLLSWPWGEPWDLEAVARSLQTGSYRWVWGIHLESSVGVLNDAAGLCALARRTGTLACLDCVSSVGAVPLEFPGLGFASGVSGKSLGSFAGLSFVLCGPGALEQVDWTRVPVSMDLNAAARTEGPRFTCPSTDLRALAVALRPYATEAARAERYAHYADLGRWFRQQLREMGAPPVAPENCAAPVVATFPTPADLPPEEFAALAAAWGFEIYGNARYLRERNWCQAATMGSLTPADLQPFFASWRRWQTL